MNTVVTYIYNLCDLVTFRLLLFYLPWENL